MQTSVSYSAEYANAESLRRADIATTHAAALRSISRVVEDSGVHSDTGAAAAGIAQMLDIGGVLVLTGAGVSTDSGIPDYRGPNGSLRRHRPMTYQEFKYDAGARHRYWARSYVGWRQMKNAQPNIVHYVLAELEEAGKVLAIITQNVDGLHSAAGARQVLPLHGDLSKIECLDCGFVEPRTALDQRLENANPGYLERLDDAELQVNPDGDVDLSDSFIADFQMVGCLSCGSEKLKPNVVYFGESVPTPRKEQAKQLLEQSSSLLIVGSSVAVMSGYKLVLDTLRAGKPVGIINAGPTRADRKATYLWRASARDALEELIDWVL
ncbi:Sir2 family NAD-dependent protein deacetylase [Rothia sp. ZJ1223]|uniref:Sir2 family NAD-dependent protein deacetylase n=1 Tax=Rothia sp. ZJ1223 TaxID=2811098 RepID=UPI0019563AAF|nr:Sir2 family NAD-dependent protein deacetylase [Rothia sp. ZJ1223]MBM7052012.1 NAD-dependent protein deacetylase [Rothia sp. ZJ1223]